MIDFILLGSCRIKLFQIFQIYHNKNIAEQRIRHLRLNCCQSGNECSLYPATNVLKMNIFSNSCLLKKPFCVQIQTLMWTLLLYCWTSDWIFNILNLFSKFCCWKNIISRKVFRKKLIIADSALKNIAHGPHRRYTFILIWLPKVTF